MIRRPLALGLFLCAASVWGQDTGGAAGGEYWSGFADIRNRWVQDVGGREQVYRSVVNLGEGPRLFDADVRYARPGGSRWLDEATASANSWGGDPYNSARFQARKSELYELRAAYRNVAYFNNLPTFANPLLGEGLLASQRALDITRRQFDIDFEWKPRSVFSPYFGFYQADGFGRGVTTFVVDGSEFPVATDLDDRLRSFRGGAKLQFERWNLTLEQGRTGFADDQQVSSLGGPQPGNRRTPFFGRELVLDELRQEYRARGRGLFSRAALQARPFSTLSVGAQFLFSQPKIDVEQQLRADGSFVSQQLLLPYSGVFEQNMADANRPHSSGSWSAEWRPWSRLRLTQNWYTDRYHVSSGSTLAQVLDAAAADRRFEDVANNLLVFRYNQHQIDASFDVAPQATVRVGHRVVWGDARTPPASLQFGPEPRNEGEVRRHVALAGAAARFAGGRVRLTSDFEASSADRTFFRTGLMNYRRGSARVRWQAHRDLVLHGSFAALDNRNDDPDIDFQFRSQRASAVVSWTPNGGAFTLLADYTRATVRSDILMVQLPFFGSDFARYRDNAHYTGAFVESALPRSVRLRLGGSLAVNAGSRPTGFYQPQISASAPLTERLGWVTEWRWYGFRESILMLESFRSHTFSAGLRFGL